MVEGQAGLEPRAAAAPGARRGLEPGSKGWGRAGRWEAGGREAARPRFVCLSQLPFPAPAPSPAAPLQTSPPQAPGSRGAREAAPGFSGCSLPCGASAGCSSPARAVVGAQPGDATRAPRPLQPVGRPRLLTGRPAAVLTFVSEPIEAAAAGWTLGGLPGVSVTV